MDLWIARVRLKDPGRLYNLGNALGFVAGLFGTLINPPAPLSEETPMLDRVLYFAAGSPAALALTAATAIFFWGGLVYSRAWLNGAPPDPRLNRHGDILSGCGAILLGIGLTLIGNPFLAAFAGALHATGKFGSALAGGRTVLWARRTIRIGDLCKDIVLVSRVPAILSAVLGLWRDLLPGSADRPFLALSALICCLVWATADWLLLSPEGLIVGAIKRLNRATIPGIVGVPPAPPRSNRAPGRLVLAGGTGFPVKSASDGNDPHLRAGLEADLADALADRAREAANRQRARLLLSASVVRMPRVL